MTTKIMIVEDEILFKEMLRLSLDAQPGLEVVGTASEGATALQLARDLKPDVVMMDIELGDGPNGIETGIEIKKAVSSIGIVLLSTHKEKEYLTSVPLDQAEGWSYLLKQSVGDIDALTRAVDGAASALVVLAPALVIHLRPTPYASRCRCPPVRPGSPAGRRRSPRCCPCVARGWWCRARGAGCRMP